MFRVIYLDPRAKRARAVRKKRALALRRARASLGGACTALLTLAVYVGAFVHLIGRSIAQSDVLSRRRALPKSQDPPPPALRRDGRLDVVDQASWESFPASDPPGY